MEHTPQDPASAISAIAERADITLQPAQSMLLATHLSMVYEAGRTMNLTTVPITDAPTVHVLDSLKGLMVMESAPEGPWADLGSGAGFPGVPLCVVGRRHVDLIESIQKKARFLDAVKAQLRLDATIRGVRAEDAARESPERYSAVTARALGSLAEIIELASPLLMLGGIAVAWKGPSGTDELPRAERAAKVAGMVLVEVRRYELPGSDAVRILVVFRKERPATMALPRRNGMAHTQPLG